MHPEQQLQARAKPCADSIQDLDEERHFLSQQIAKIAVRLQTALEQVKIRHLSTP